MRVLVLAVNAAYFAVPMATVLQVLRHPVVTRVPLSPSGLLGVVNVRGEIVPATEDAWWCSSMSRSWSRTGWT